MKNLFIVLVFLSLSSCDKWAIEKKGLDVNSSFTISSYISPDDSVHTVSVFSLKPADESILTKDLNSLIIKNAFVFISNKETNDNFELKYVDSLMAYAGKFIIKENTRYFLRVKVDWVEATSSCLVPGKAIITSDGIELTKLNEEKLNVKVSWKEPSGSNVAFSVLNQFKFGNSGMNIFPTGSFEIFDKPDPVNLEYSLEGDFSIPNSNFRDAYFEIDIISLSAEMTELTEQMRNNNIVIGVNSYGFFQKFIPLKPLYSNITNGYGVFGAYNTVKLQSPYEN